MKMSTRITALVFSILILTSMVIAPVSAGLLGDASCPVCGDNNLIGGAFYTDGPFYYDEFYHAYYFGQWFDCGSCGATSLYYQPDPEMSELEFHYRDTCINGTYFCICGYEVPDWIK